MERSTPGSPPSSSDSPRPSTTSSVAEWRRSAGLFVATVASVALTQLAQAPSWIDALQYTAALLTILLVHEFGHYVAARLHGVDASPPHFLPLPLLSPFGTLGAFIRMRSPIPSRRALLDIGASGPLAGLAVAIPLYVLGLRRSPIAPLDPDKEYVQLGSSLLLRLLDPPTPPGTDITLSPVAYAAWTGMLVTMVNLVPVAQLDGGHVAYALFGRRQDAFAKVLHRALLGFFVATLAAGLLADVRVGAGLLHFGAHAQKTMFWFVWFHVLAVLGAVSSPPAPPAPGNLTVPMRIGAGVGLALVAALLRSYPSNLGALVWIAAFGVLVAMDVRGGVLRDHALLDHPPTRGGPNDRLDVVRTFVGIVALAAFVLLFMPSPIVAP